MFCALLGHTGERLQDRWSSGFINNGQICMGVFADNLKKCTKTTYLNGFLEK